MILLPTVVIGAEVLLQPICCGINYSTTVSPDPVALSRFVRAYKDSVFVARKCRRLLKGSVVLDRVKRDEVPAKVVAETFCFGLRHRQQAVDSRI